MPNIAEINFMQRSKAIYEVTIDNSANPNALSDYQVLTDISADPVFFGDAEDRRETIRVFDEDMATPLKYYIEGWDVVNDNAKIWAKVPSIPASSIKKIYITINPTRAQDLSNADATFDFYEDFTSNPNTNGKWEVYRYTNDTSNEFVYDSANRRVYLTKAVDSKGCFAFMKKNGALLSLPSNFTIKFKGGGGGGDGADGWSFGFFKNASPYQTYGKSTGGGALGLMAYDGTNKYISAGYAVEFDNYQNSGDPSANHNALVDTNVTDPYNHLARYDTNRANEDNATHAIEIFVYNGNVKLYVDDSLHFSYSGTISRTYLYGGFGAGTGGLNNNHWVQEYVIIRKYTEPEPTVSYSRVMSISPFENLLELY